MINPIRSIIQTRHPELADELRNAINVMEKVLHIAGPMAPHERKPVEAVSEGTEILATGEFTAEGQPANDILATSDSQASLATDRPGQLEEYTPAELAVGEAFGRYQIINLLGKGSIGTVYLAYDPRLERHVAIKIPFLRGNSRRCNDFMWRRGPRRHCAVPIFAPSTTLPTSMGFIISRWHSSRANRYPS